MTVVVESSFMGDFKIGDNICYNLRVLKTLYRAQETAPLITRHIFVKPIVVNIASVLEAVLHDFHMRIRNNTREGVANLVTDAMDYIRGLKRIDELAQYIDSARKHDLFDDGPTFYDDLHELRKARNRVHIQNLKKYLPKDEASLFNSILQRKAERLLERTLRVMEIRYSRGPQFAYVGNFELPWEPHFPMETDIPF